MYLYRLSIVKFGEPIGDKKVFGSNFGGVGLTVGDRVSNSKILENEFVFTASIKIPKIPVSKELFWDIPDSERRRCEEVIECSSSIVGIKYRTSKEIWSPSGCCVALRPETKAEKDALESCKGFADQFNNFNLQPSSPLDTLVSYEEFVDRKDGLSLLSEALSHSTASGGFRDYIRLFENAFLSPTAQLKKKLVQFLPENMGYSNEEVQRWVELRDPLSHADSRKAKKVLYDADVAPIIARVQQAAYDVFFNKLIWGEKSKTRKEKFSPKVYSTGPGKEPPVVIEGASVSIRKRDKFGVYPERMTGSIADLKGLYLVK